MEDRYKTLDVIAHGAMATVWRAQDVRLGRVVAIKRPHRAPDIASAESGFADAARSAAAVAHPNLITILDADTDDLGPYLVMEFVDGPTLAEMGGAPSGAAALGSAVASGLSALHAAGIVHRDVRPSNILLGPTGPKLTDFGTARTVDFTGGSNTALPRFEAPEVLAGGQSTTATDVYSLGAVLSWLANQTAPDPELAAIVDQAMSDEPGARPTAPVLAERLRKIIPTPTAMAAATPMAANPMAASQTDDATREYDGPLVEAPPALSADETDTVQESRSPGRRIAAVIAVVLLAFVVAALALTGDDDAPPIAGDTTIVETTTTTSPDLVETDAPGTTAAEEEGGVFNTVRIFVTFIRETPSNVLSSTGADEIISDVADGVSEAIRGNAEEAQSNLEDAVETVQEEIDSPTVIDRAIELIARLARQLGLDLEEVPEPSG